MRWGWGVGGGSNLTNIQLQSCQSQPVVVYAVFTANGVKTPICIKRDVNNYKHGAMQYSELMYDKFHTLYIIR